MRATIPIAVQPNTKVLRLERVFPEKPEMPYWRIWLYHDLALTQGTYLRLYHSGVIERVTTDADGIEQVVLIKDRDSR